LLLSELRNEFPDANHHCWAIILGSPDASHGQDQSDDGEPKNTAGKPMLNVLQHSGLGHVMAIVTRYFGGVKLGAGGLVRAYSSAVSEAIKEFIKIIDQDFSDSINLILEYPVTEKLELLKIIDEVGQGKITYSDQE